MTIIDPRYKQYQYNTIQTLTTNATNGNGGANGANNTIQTPDEFLEAINQKLGSGDKTAIEELQKKGVPAIVTESDDGAYKVQYTYGRMKYTVTYFPPSDSNKNGENVNNNENNNSVPPQTTTPPVPSTPPLSNTQPADDGVDNNVTNDDINKDNSVNPPSVGTTGTEGVDKSKDVEGVEKAEGVDEAQGTNSVTATKWAGLVDENDPQMIFQLLGYDDLTILRSPATGQWIAENMEEHLYEIISDPYCKTEKLDPNIGTGIYGTEYSDELQNLPYVFFDLKTGEFLVEKAKQFLATQNEFECFGETGSHGNPIQGNMEEIAPGLFKMTGTSKVADVFNCTETTEETKMYIYDPTNKQFIELPKEKKYELGTITQTTFFDLVTKSPYMANAMSKYIENGILKIDPPIFHYTNDTYSKNYTQNAQDAFKNFVNKAYNSNDTINYCLENNVIKFGSKEYTQLYPGAWGAKGENGSPDTIEFVFNGYEILPLNCLYSENENEFLHGTLRSVSYKTKEQYLDHLIVNIANMSNDIHNKYTNKMGKLSDEQIVTKQRELEAQVHLYCALTGSNEFYAGLINDELLVRENEYGYKESVKDDRYIATDIISNYTYTHNNVIHYNNSDEFIDVINLLTSATLTKDTPNFTATDLRNFFDDAMTAFGGYSAGKDVQWETLYETFFADNQNVFDMESETDPVLASIKNIFNAENFDDVPNLYSIDFDKKMKDFWFNVCEASNVHPAMAYYEQLANADINYYHDYKELGIARGNLLPWLYTWFEDYHPEYMNISHISEIPFEVFVEFMEYRMDRPRWHQSLDYELILKYLKEYTEFSN